jgi:NAD(P)-dependent dehydrogenase (short-subunit alcohol dehydrogenase family)
MGINFWGVIYGSKTFLPLFRKRGAGHIVNISSINGMVPFAFQTPYNCSKYAVLGFSETMMQELRGQPIQITSVHPGGIRTNIARSAIGADPKVAAGFDDCRVGRRADCPRHREQPRAGVRRSRRQDHVRFQASDACPDGQLLGSRLQLRPLGFAVCFCLVPRRGGAAPTEFLRHGVAGGRRAGPAASRRSP